MLSYMAVNITNIGMVHAYSSSSFITIILQSLQKLLPTLAHCFLRLQIFLLLDDRGLAYKRFLCYVTWTWVRVLDVEMCLEVQFI